MKKEKKVIGCLVMITSLSLLLMGLMINRNVKNREGVFVPPAFEEDVMIGTPTVEDNLGWTKISQENMSFSAHLCGHLILKEGKAKIFFTNDSNNHAWLKLRILNLDNQVLAETGIIKAGEYVENIDFQTKPNNQDYVKLKLMSYEPETYYSLGSVILNTQISVEES